MNKKDKEEVKQLIDEAVKPLVEHIHELTRILSTLSELAQAQTEASIGHSEMLRSLARTTGDRRDVTIIDLDKVGLPSLTDEEVENFLASNHRPPLGFR